MTRIVFSLIIVFNTPTGSLWFSFHVDWYICFIYLWSFLLGAICEYIHVHLWFDAVVNDRSYMYIIWFSIHVHVPLLLSLSTNGFLIRMSLGIYMDLIVIVPYTVAIRLYLWCDLMCSFIFIQVISKQITC